MWRTEQTEDLAEDPSGLRGGVDPDRLGRFTVREPVEELPEPLVRHDVRQVRWLLASAEWLTAMSGPAQTHALLKSQRASSDVVTLTELCG